nr:unnamed protein product [Spirometra erinaceieuropaei]
MMARVTDNGASSEAFAVASGGKQGCVLAPSLFSLIFSVMLMEAYRDERSGIHLGGPRPEQTGLEKRIEEADRIAAAAVAKVSVEARKSRLSRLLSAKHPPLPTRPCCQRASCAQIGPVGHLRTQYAVNQVTSTSSPTLALLQTLRRPPPSSPPITISLSFRHRPPTASTLPQPRIDCSGQHHHQVFTHFPTQRTTTDVSSTPNIVDIPTSSDADSAYVCSHRDRTFNSQIGPVGHLRIHRTETIGSVLGTPSYTLRIRSNRSHCTRTFTHGMGLLGRMRVHENLR